MVGCALSLGAVPSGLGLAGQVAFNHACHPKGRAGSLKADIALCGLLWTASRIPDNRWF
jgi:hypothetical protein